MPVRIQQPARIPFAAIVGGVVFFVWGAVAHMVLPLGMMGLENIPNEGPMLDAFRRNITRPGLYFFPGLPEETPSMAQSERDALMKQFEEKYRQGPAGLVVIDPDGGEVMTPGQLGTEFLCNVVAALVAAFLLSCTGGHLTSYAQRVLFVALLGVFTSAMSGVQLWNWYGFPTPFMIAGVIEEVVGALLAGLAIAAIVKPSPAMQPVSPPSMTT